MYILKNGYSDLMDVSITYFRVYLYLTIFLIKYNEVMKSTGQSYFKIFKKNLKSC